MFKLQDYAIRIEPLPREEGGGFLVTVPDLSGCVADGESIEAAIAEAHDAFKAWAAAEQQDRGMLPTPKTYSGEVRAERRRDPLHSEEGAVQLNGSAAQDPRPTRSVCHLRRSRGLIPFQRQQCDMSRTPQCLSSRTRCIRPPVRIRGPCCRRVVGSCITIVRSA